MQRSALTADVIVVQHTHPLYDVKSATLLLHVDLNVIVYFQAGPNIEACFLQDLHAMQLETLAPFLFLKVNMSWENSMLPRLALPAHGYAANALLRLEDVPLCASLPDQALQGMCRRDIVTPCLAYSTSIICFVLVDFPSGETPPIH